jgi:hypothetical protein
VLDRNAPPDIQNNGSSSSIAKINPHLIINFALDHILELITIKATVQISTEKCMLNRQHTSTG